MPRNDSILYTGQSSATRRAEKIAERQREKAEKRVVLLPTEKLIIEFLDKERDDTITQLLGLVNPSTPEADVKSAIVSLTLYRQSIANTKNRLLSILRHANNRTEMDDES
jgi:hypothetical protein